VDLCEQVQLAFLPWAPIQDAEGNRAVREAAARHRAVREAAARHGLSERQVMLAWLLARSPQNLPIPGSGSAEHVESNIASCAVEVAPDEVAALTKGG
jgi:pyridoxine 4-dehydrogenase